MDENHQSPECPDVANPGCGAIETISKRGYRFVGSIGELAREQLPTPGQTGSGGRWEDPRFRDVLARMGRVG